MRQPAIFFGHGNPMNALADNAYTQAWRRIGAELQRPAAILAISAHWYAPFTALTGVTAPRTIHDFGGFPRELFEFKYPAPGDPKLAVRVAELLEPLEASIDMQWGLDHGTWSVLTHLFPDADIPIVQLSIDERQPPQFHFDVGTQLAPLRDENVLIVGSGNVVHNLHAYAWGRHPAQPFDWAVRFDALVRELLTNGRTAHLVDYESLGRDALLSAPTPDHYLPLLYVAGASAKDDAVSFPVEGMDGGSISMLSVRFDSRV